ncbi:MAG TPA: hypothetical protein VEC99_00135, partial [Clostridia bacterium]|nr:hypothetical protein [Clostridia bacterium]
MTRKDRCLGWPSIDKGEGFVKDRVILSGVCDTAWLPEEEVDDQDPGHPRVGRVSAGGSELDVPTLGSPEDAADEGCKDGPAFVQVHYRSNK